ncbi:hypothetical protein HH310_35655 [Actinoplanes sp. TBRC 11911]|uniref:hypothetical protein n=1 Tax=Actinoplanes sp. TBRC 11911 TaxID=2729386 RepID=UPI00145DCA9E|nr:hypothetical protein [Actinoplanes sp. TBRC 11911]NMO56502.1 hypothetical protein [Actinoplanes sp. TBRC 11911]
MLYGTPSRAAHRATDDGLGQLIRGGLHRQPARIAIEPERAADRLVRGLAGMIVLGVAVMIGFLAVGDETRGAPITTPAAADQPLTLGDVFPEPESVPGTDYRIVVKHIDADCASATVGRLSAMLAAYGCDQVVRAALNAPRGDYQVTAGIFTLLDAAAADRAAAGVRDLVETGDGGFSSMVGGLVGQTAWHARGPYLLYCVVTRPGGGLVTPDDPEAARITAEIVDGYLSESVLARRGSSA